MVGGAPMYPSKNIVENAVNSKDHTTLVAAVKAAGLVETLEGAGPFTVFAPTNEAFAALPKGTVETLLKPENKGQLTAVLTYHVVAGRYTAEDIDSKIDQMGGKLTLNTVQGEPLTFERSGKMHITVTDAKGDVARITIPTSSSRTASSTSSTRCCCRCEERPPAAGRRRAARRCRVTFCPLATKDQ